MEDLRVVFESRNRKSCSDRALVLAALQIPHQLVDDGESCALVVPADPGAPPTLDVLRSAVKEHLPGFCAPRRVVIVESLPRTTLGKLERSLLRRVAD